jgi:hypothetical protein
MFIDVEECGGNIVRVNESERGFMVVNSETDNQPIASWVPCEPGGELARNCSKIETA